MSEIVQKECLGCHQVFPWTGEFFEKKSLSKDGKTTYYRSRCKPCFRQMPAYKEKRKRQSRRRYTENPQKYRDRAKTHYYKAKRKEYYKKLKYLEELKDVLVMRG